MPTVVQKTAIAAIMINDVADIVWNMQLVVVVFMFLWVG